MNILFSNVECNVTSINYDVANICYKKAGCFFEASRIPSAFIKPDQLDPGIKDQIKITLLPTISHLQLLNFVSCGRACPSHMTQNLVTVGAKLWTAKSFLFDPWSLLILLTLHISESQQEILLTIEQHQCIFYGNAYHGSICGTNGFDNFLWQNILFI